MHKIHLYSPVLKSNSNMKRLSEKFTLDLKSDTISALTVDPEAFAFALGGVIFMVVIVTFA